MKARQMIINFASILAILSLLVCLLSGILAFMGALEFEKYKMFFNLASLVWFLSAPFWLVPQLFGTKFAEAGKEAWLRFRH